jgi:DNA-binding PadR family transcriptional regulator
MTEQVSLTPTSYLVLGLVARRGPITPYGLKQVVASSIGYFWRFPHSQLYAEPARLATLGLLAEEVEEGGRKRKSYTVTAAGRRRLERWLAQPVTEPTEIRDLGLLKLFFSGLGAEEHRVELAREQLRAHAARQAEYERLHRLLAHRSDPQEVHTLDMGLRFERAMVAFWRELAED